MEKRKLISYIIIGATLGAASALFNKDVRRYTKETYVKVKDKTSHLVSHPSETVGDLREKLEKANQKLSRATGQAINTLEKIEETMEKYID